MLCGYLAGCLVLRFQRSNGQIPGYQARTSPPARQRIAYRVQALGGSGKAFRCFLSSRGGVILPNGPLAVISSEQPKRSQ
jgi:hypothetical protein